MKFYMSENYSNIITKLTSNGAPILVDGKELTLIQPGAIDAAVQKVLAANPAEVEAYRGGKTKLISFFVGQVMREMRGKANPAVVNEALAKFLG